MFSDCIFSTLPLDSVAPQTFLSLQHLFKKSLRCVIRPTFLNDRHSLNCWMCTSPFLLSRFDLCDLFHLGYRLFLTSFRVSVGIFFFFFSTLFSLSLLIHFRFFPEAFVFCNLSSALEFDWPDSTKGRGGQVNRSAR